MARQNSVYWDDAAKKLRERGKLDFILEITKPIKRLKPDDLPDASTTEVIIT